MKRYAIVQKEETSWMWFVVMVFPMWMWVSDGGDHHPQPGTKYYAKKADAKRDAKRLGATVVEWVTA